MYVFKNVLMLKITYELTFEETFFLYFRLIYWNFCFVFIVKTLTMICIVVKSVKIYLLAVQNRFTHELAHDTCKLKF